jgi:hypothetical protein
VEPEFGWADASVQVRQVSVRRSVGFIKKIRVRKCLISNPKIIFLYDCEKLILLFFVGE